MQHSENVYKYQEMSGMAIRVDADVRFARNPRPLARYLVTVVRAL
jgi:hypothetical protein